MKERRGIVLLLCFIFLVEKSVSNDESRKIVNLIDNGVEEELMMLSESEDKVCQNKLITWYDMEHYMSDVRAFKRVEMYKGSKVAAGLSCYEYERSYDVLSINSCWLTMAYSIVCRHLNDSINFYKTWSSDGVYLCPTGIPYNVSDISNFARIRHLFRQQQQPTVSNLTQKVAVSHLSFYLESAAYAVGGFLCSYLLWLFLGRLQQRLAKPSRAGIGFVYPQDDENDDKGHKDIPVVADISKPPPNYSSRMARATQILAGKKDPEIIALENKLYEMSKEKGALIVEKEKFQQMVLDKVTKANKAKERVKRDVVPQVKGEAKVNLKDVDTLFEDVESLEDLFTEIPNKTIVCKEVAVQTEADDMSNYTSTRYGGVKYLVKNSLFEKAVSFKKVFEDAYIDDGEDPDSDSDDEEEDSDDDDDEQVRDPPALQLLKHVKLIHASRCANWVKEKKKENSGWNVDSEIQEWQRIFSVQNTMFNEMPVSRLLSYIIDEDVFPIPDLNGYKEIRHKAFDTDDFYSLKALTVVTPKRLMTAASDVDRLIYLRDMMGEICGMMQRGTKSKFCNKLVNLMIDLTSEARI